MGDSGNALEIFDIGHQVGSLPGAKPDAIDLPMRIRSSYECKRK